MKAILVVAHGSRAKETEATLTAILEMVEKKVTDVHIEHAYMEFSDKTIEKGIEFLVGKGASEIKIVPYFLFEGIHLKEDIPDIVNECMQSYPDVRVVMGQTLGVDERLADIIVDRIKV